MPVCVTVFVLITLSTLLSFLLLFLYYWRLLQNSLSNFFLALSLSIYIYIIYIYIIAYIIYYYLSSDYLLIKYNCMSKQLIHSACQCYFDSFDSNVFHNGALLIRLNKIGLQQDESLNCRVRVFLHIYMCFIHLSIIT